METITKKWSLLKTHPDIAKEWSDKNGTLLPKDVTKGQTTIIWWECKKKHLWQGSIIDRTLRNKNCPYCCRKTKVCLDTCLLYTHPDIAKEWNIERNEITSSDVLSGSKKKVWWKCINGHEWQASVNNRTKPKGTGCPLCVKFPLSLRKDLVSQWHEKNSCQPETISLHSGKSFWWKCPIATDHEWKASVCNRVKGKGNCPCCLLRKVVSSNCLATTHPELVKEWHPSNVIRPSEVTIGSTKPVLWQCQKQPHVWQTKIYHRKKSNCPYCKSSKGEQAIEEYLLSNNVKFKREWTHDDCKYIQKLRFDFSIYNEDQVIGLIEYQGIQHSQPVGFGQKDDLANKFAETKKRDKIKCNFCKGYNIPFLQIDYRESMPLKILQNFLNRIKNEPS